MNNENNKDMKLTGVVAFLHKELRTSIGIFPKGKKVRIHCETYKGNEKIYAIEIEGQSELIYASIDYLAFIKSPFEGFSTSEGINWHKISESMNRKALEKKTGMMSSDTGQESGSGEYACCETDEEMSWIRPDPNIPDADKIAKALIREEIRLRTYRCVGPAIGDCFNMLQDARVAGNKILVTTLEYMHERLCKVSYDLRGVEFDRDLPQRPDFIKNETPVATNPNDLLNGLTELLKSPTVTAIIRSAFSKPA